MFKHISESVALLLEKIVDKGIELTLSKDKEGELYFDLNTQAKSHLYLYPLEDNEVLLKGRYGYSSTIEYYGDFDTFFHDICSEVKHCLQGRDFMNTNWLEILVEQGLLHKKTETKTTYF